MCENQLRKFPSAWLWLISSFHCSPLSLSELSEAFNAPFYEREREREEFESNKWGQRAKLKPVLFLVLFRKNIKTTEDLQRRVKRKKEEEVQSQKAAKSIHPSIHERQTPIQTLNHTASLMCNNTEGTRQNMLTPQHLRVKSMTFLLGSSGIHSTNLNPTSIQQFKDKCAKNNVGKAKVRGGESPARHADTRANRVNTELNTLGSESYLITVCAVCLWHPLLWQYSVRATRPSPQCHKVYMTT